jgi:type II secretory pathway predicted ATPase ExeA
LSGLVGSGKTTILRRVQRELLKEKEISVAKSLSVDKDRLKLNTLIIALFYDLATEKDFKMPTQPEKRERKLCELVRKCRKPVVLFIDEAHDLHSKTLVGLKRLIEMIQDNESILSIVLAVHPKLKNDLRNPRLEEIGSRAIILELTGINSQRREYIEWLLKNCVRSKTKIETIFLEEAITLLAERPTTPLQIEYYLNLAMEEAYKVGLKPINAEIIRSILARSIDSMEPTLARNGYNVKSLADILNLRPAEVKSFLQGQLAPARTEDIRYQMVGAGIPV